MGAGGFGAGDGGAADFDELVGEAELPCEEEESGADEDPEERSGAPEDHEGGGEEAEGSGRRWGVWGDGIEEHAEPLGEHQAGDSEDEEAGDDEGGVPAALGFDAEDPVGGERDGEGGRGGWGELVGGGGGRGNW